MVNFKWDEIIKNATQLVQQHKKVKLDRTVYKKLGLGNLNEEDMELVKRYIINARGDRRYHILVDADHLKVAEDSDVFKESLVEPSVYMVEPKLTQLGADDIETDYIKIGISNGLVAQFKKEDIKDAQHTYQTLHKGLSRKLSLTKQKLLGHLLLILMAVVLHFALAVNSILVALIYVGGLIILGRDVNAEELRVEQSIQDMLGDEERYIASVLFLSIRDWIGYQKTQDLIHQYSNKGAWDDVYRYESAEAGDEA